MQLEEFVGQIRSFEAMAAKDRIKLFVWWLHSYCGKDLIGTTEIRGCYAKLHLDEPPALATYMSRMVSSKDFLREKGKFKLARNARMELDKKYGVHESIVAVAKILSDLPIKVPNIAERDFINEALVCYRHKAFRACIVMTWNLVYTHLLHWILRDPMRLVQFNSAIVARFPKLTGLRITKYDDFGDNLKESQVLDICKSASLVNSNISKILKEKLEKRNIAAHPSGVIVAQSQADDVITDLINNVVLRLI